MEPGFWFINNNNNRSSPDAVVKLCAFCRHQSSCHKLARFLEGQSMKYCSRFSKKWKDERLLLNHEKNEKKTQISVFAQHHGWFLCTYLVKMKMKLSQTKNQKTYFKLLHKNLDQKSLSSSVHGGRDLYFWHHCGCAKRDLFRIVDEAIKLHHFIRERLL